jgi:hypothetical protein
MIGFHACENQRAIFNPILTYNGVNWFSLWESDQEPPNISLNLP